MKLFALEKPKLIFLILLFLLNISSCQGNKTINNDLLEHAEHKSIYKELGLSKYDPPIEVSFIRETNDDLDPLLSLLNETLEDNRWSQIYEEVLGIHIQYDWLATGNLYRQKLNYSVSSGRLPDIIKVGTEKLRELSNADLIQDLSHIYEQYATVFTKEVFSQEGAGPFNAATIDGKLMAIPLTNSTIEGAMYIWIRTDWLEKLNLQPPKTMDDVLAISQAFTYLDPDQNGMDDTFGLAITNYLWDPVMGIKGFMAGYEAYPELWILDEAGNLVYGGVQPEVKTALKVLQEMYQAGQLDSEFSFKNGSKVKQQIVNGNIGLVYGEQWGSFLVQGSRSLDPNADWKAYPIVSATGELPKVPLKFNTWEYFAVNKNFDHPEAIIKLINLHLEKNWGETAEFETYYSTPHAAWQLSPVTPYPAKKNLEAYRQLEKARRTSDWSALNAEAKLIQKLIDTFLSGDDELEHGWGWEKTYGNEGAFAILDQYEKNDQLLYEKFTGGTTETMIERQTLLHDLQHETYINIILGNSIDEFDEFVDMWHILGGEKITVEVNEWYKQNN